MPAASKYVDDEPLAFFIDEGGMRSPPYEIVNIMAQLLEYFLARAARRPRVFPSIMSREEI